MMHQTENVQRSPISKYIICIEGIDGCGKDTQLKLLEKDGFYVSSEPNYSGPIGKLIGDVMKKQITLNSKNSIEYLFAADRIEHLEIMRRHVASHTTEKEKLCITGRYKYSGYVYSEVPQISTYVNWSMPEAGLFIFLNIKPAHALKRIKSRIEDGTSKYIEMYENIEKLTNVNKGFKQLIKSFKSTHRMSSHDTTFPDVVMINAELSPEEIHKRIIKVIDRYIKKRL